MQKYDGCKTLRVGVESDVGVLSSEIHMHRIGKDFKSIYACVLLSESSSCWA